MTLQEKKILLICSYYKIVTMNKMWKECHKLKNMINISKNLYSLESSVVMINVDDISVIELMISAVPPRDQSIGVMVAGFQDSGT